MVSNLVFHLLPNGSCQNFLPSSCLLPYHLPLPPWCAFNAKSTFKQFFEVSSCLNCYTARTYNSDLLPSHYCPVLENGWKNGEYHSILLRHYTVSLTVKKALKRSYLTRANRGRMSSVGRALDFREGGRGSDSWSRTNSQGLYND